LSFEQYLLSNIGMSVIIFNRFFINNVISDKESDAAIIIAWTTSLA